VDKAVCSRRDLKELTENIYIVCNTNAIIMPPHKMSGAHLQYLITQHHNASKSIKVFYTHACYVAYKNKKKIEHKLQILSKDQSPYKELKEHQKTWKRTMMPLNQQLKVTPNGILLPLVQPKYRSSNKKLSVRT
jgi:hypothetical protein